MWWLASAPRLMGWVAQYLSLVGGKLWFSFVYRF